MVLHKEIRGRRLNMAPATPTCPSTKLLKRNESWSSTATNAPVDTHSHSTEIYDP